MDLAEEVGKGNAETEHHSHTENAIEAVLDKTEQSYEEFMACFVGLKKEDVVAYHVRRLQGMLDGRENDRDLSEGQSSEVDLDQTKGNRPMLNPRLNSGEEDIDTEELDEGMYAPSRQATDLCPGHKFVQMDNFVDDADLLDEDNMQEGQDKPEEFASFHYESSFGPASSSTNSPLRLSEDPAARIGEAENTKEANHRLGDDTEKEQFPRADEMECDDSCLGIVDNSAVSPLKLSRDLLKKTKEGDGGEVGQDERSGCPLELRGGWEMKTLPGEAEEEGDAPSSPISDQAVHRTELMMSSRRDLEAANQNQESEACPETPSDEVQPFSLDTDFDYDNVALTPKWDSNHGPLGWNSGLH